MASLLCLGEQYQECKKPIYLHSARGSVPGIKSRKQIDGLSNFYLTLPRLTNIFYINIDLAQTIS